MSIEAGRVSRFISRVAYKSGSPRRGGVSARLGCARLVVRLLGRLAAGSTCLAVKSPLSVSPLSVSPTALAAAVTLAFCWTFGTAGATLADERFDIPAQPLESALKEFARQADIEVLFTGEDVARLRSRRVSGALTREEAIAGLLDGTGLIFEFETEGLLIVRLASETAARGGTPGGAPLSPGGTLRVAELESAPRQTDAGDADFADASFADGDADEDSLENIVVTGTLIRGTKSAVGSKLVVVDQQEIERGGFGNVQEAIQSLPNVFRGGISEDSRSLDNNNNLSGGTSINLRGLGVGNTLTLVNGRRLAPGGLAGAFVDVSNIPATLIARIEVLADGASATYGSDAIGGVVNVILRDDFDGAETGLRFGTVTEGGTQEYRASQTFGKAWDSGHAVISYEYYKREELGYEDRTFTASSDLRPLGGDDFRTNASVPGNILGGSGFAIPDGQDGTNLAVDDLLPGQVNLFNENPARSLLLDQERHSVLVTASQELDERVELFAEGRFSDRDFERGVPQGARTLRVPSSNPFFVDPFGDSPFVRVSYNTLVDFGGIELPGQTRTYNAVLGVKTDLWGDWQIQAYGSYSRESRVSMSRSLDTTALNAALADPKPATAFNPFGDGSFQQNPDTIDSIVFSVPRRGKSGIWTGNIVSDGSLFQLPGGAIKLALGANLDKYSLDSFTDTGPLGIIETADQRDVVAVFGEILVPLFDEDNRRPGLERLIVSASVRYEDYDDVGDTANPKVGLIWGPIDGLDIRGTYGTSFRAPDLVELDIASNGTFIFPLSDPSSPTGSTLSLILNGNNSELENETATTWTVGFDYAPPSAPGLSFDLTYYNIDFDNRISSAFSAGFGILFQEQRFTSAIIRNPTEAQIDEACDVGGTNFDIGFGPCRTTAIGAIVDFRLINAAITKTDGLDFNIRYRFDAGNIGRLNLHMGGTYIFSFDEAFGPTAPIAELVNTVGNPIGLTLRNSVIWDDQNGLSAAIYLNYSDSYTDNVSDPERKIESWTTVDLTLTYRTEGRLANVGLNDIRLSLSIRNLFDTDPPFVNNPLGIGYDPENASPLGRFISFTITKTW
ncbi:MAG: TonB-dependent receptor [Sphingomonadales bacterium]|nr:TonB-dependent receptor [Sphingomonadales bacterium]